MKLLKQIVGVFFITASASGVRLVQEQIDSTKKSSETDVLVVDQEPELSILLDVTVMQERIQSAVVLEKYESCLNGSGQIGYKILELHHEHNQPKHPQFFSKQYTEVLKNMSIGLQASGYERSHAIQQQVMVKHYCSQDK